MKKTVSIILILALFSLILAGCNSGSSPDGDPGTAINDIKNQTDSLEPLVIRYTASSAPPPGTPSAQMQKKFIELVETKSGGTIKVDFLPGGSVVSTEREFVEAMQLGTIDIGTCSDMGIDSVIGGLGWAWLPYMITTYEDADKYYFNGWMNKEIERIMGEKGLVKIANIENDFRIVGNSKHPILTLEDLKGMKIRVPEIPELLRFYELSGALSVAIAASETLTALKQKTIDGIDNSVINLEALGTLSSIKYLTSLNHMYSAGSWIVNPNFWNNLTDEQRAILTECCKEAGDLHIKLAREASAKLLGSEGEAKYGYEVSSVPDELDAELKKVARQVWEEYSPNYDPAMMKKVMETFGN